MARGGKPVKFAKYCPSEYEECLMFVEWSRYQRNIDEYDLIHIPNEGKRSPAQGAKLKKCGLVPGVSDYLMLIPSEHYHGLALEMKRSVKSKSKVSPQQSAFIERQIEKGYYGTVCYGADAAIDVVTRYLNNEIFDVDE